MDPVTLVSSAVALLSPYLVKGAEEFSKELGKEAAQKARDLFTYLKNTFTHDSEESQVLSLFEKKPEKYETVLSDVLVNQVKSDKAFAGELEKHIQGAGPYIKVIQKLRHSKDVTGIEVNEVRTGTFDVNQEADDVERIVGFKADKVG